MCGIAGFVDRSIAAPHARARLDAMLQSIYHRGPDGEGAFQDEKLGLALGMRRLSIIDLAGGAQPIWNEAQNICAFFNGEIYNYVELRKTLIAKGHQFRTDSDTEVLVHAYEEYGADMVTHLRGMFGFVIFDRVRKTLFLARDHFGQKPLYYCFQGDRFAFASEIKALLLLPWVPRDLDPESFLDFISWFSVPAPQTHFKAIAKMEAGTCLTVKLPIETVPKPVRYWRYPCMGLPPITTMDEAVDALEAAFEDSTRIHLRSDVPVGVLLSSGLDSRAVAAFAVKSSAPALQTFSVGFEGVPESEHVEAAQTAKELGTKHHSLMLTAKDLAESIDKVAWHLDEPIGDPAAFALLKICQLARDHVKVLLGGEGSDELFGGYATRYHGMMQTLAKTNRWRWLSRVIPANGQSYPRTSFARLRHRIHTTAGAEAVGLRREGFPGDVRNPQGLTEPQLIRLFTREQELADRMYQPLGDPLTEMTALDVSWQLPDSLLLKSDKMSMAASIELRCPFLDPEVAKVASRISSHLKLSADGLVGKLPLRRCLDRKFPEPSARPKRGFPIPLAEWFAGEMNQRLYECVFNSEATWRSKLEATRVETAWDGLQQGDSAHARSFYALWLYESWSFRLRSLQLAD